VKLYAFVDAQKTDFTVTTLCRVCNVSTSGYYAWRVQVAAGPCDAARDDAEVLERIRRIHHKSRGRYGEPRITAQLGRDGEPVNHKRVERLMAANGICGRSGRKKVRTTVRDPNAALSADLVNRRFEQTVLDTLWVGDATYIPTDEGWLYLATVIDACSRRLLGWSMTDHLRTELCLDALDAAVDTRGGKANIDGVIFHSDHGRSIHRRRRSRCVHQVRRHPVDGHCRRQLRQRDGRIVLRVAEARAGRRRTLRDAR
jgi:transposase InsO family protein